ncbi:hypothetical protein AC578_10776 [Pseudocercospora eumusae]|uniref:Uncharacterized protein n=1 Tax=Pseudocercospora eumusae TaxID=321146 RepID=A0A139GZU2_9PEZI|nr:hypothetical protein AC578_10776 [Pseudocercospora eumusae]
MSSILHVLGTYVQAIGRLLVSLVTALLTKLSPTPGEPLVYDPSHTLFTYNCLHYAVITIDQPNADTHTFDHVFSTFSELADRHIVSTPVKAHIALPGNCPRCQRLRRKNATFFDLDFRHRATQAIKHLEANLNDSRTTLLQNGEKYHQSDFLAKVKNLTTRDCRILHNLFSSAPQPSCCALWTQLATNISLATNLLNAALLDTKALARLINDSRFSLTRIHAQLYLVHKGMEIFIRETNRLRTLEKKFWGLEKEKKKKKIRSLDREPKVSVKRFREGGSVELRRVAMRNAVRVGWEGRMEGIRKGEG